MVEESRTCFATAAGLDLTIGSSSDLDSPTLAEALREHGVLCRRGRRYQEAVDACQHILALCGCLAHIAHEAIEALAVYHEHRPCDLDAARRFATQALRFKASATRAQAVRH